jgi:hypothetical protein
VSFSLLRFGGLHQCVIASGACRNVGLAQDVGYDMR